MRTLPLPERQFGLLGLGIASGYLVNGMFHDVSIIPHVGAILFLVLGGVVGCRVPDAGVPLAAQPLVVAGVHAHHRGALVADEVVVGDADGQVAEESGTEEPPNTEAVIRTDLVELEEFDGTLQAVEEQTIASTTSGIITAVASEGSSLGEGDLVYAVDGTAVPPEEFTFAVPYTNG